jgi:hypothetical protein
MIGGTMYRTPSGEQTGLASAIREHTSGPCWRRDEGSTAPCGKSVDAPASAFETIAVQPEAK